MSAAEKMTVTVPYNAPIPVGHRIELRFFMEEKGVINKHKALNAHLPLIRDLDTGVEYCHFDHYLKVWGLSPVPLPPHEYPMTLRTDLEWTAPVTARVVTCRVLTEAFGEHFQVQTTIVCEPEQ